MEITKDELLIFDETLCIMQYISKHYKNNKSIKVLEGLNNKLNDEFIRQHGEGDIE